MNEGSGHIFIDEQITPETYAMVKKSLAEFANRDKIILHIASPGGSVYAGYNIYNALKLSKKSIKTIIEGEAQSMATFIALAGDEIEICNPSVFMIHMPHSAVEGTREGFIQGASELKTIEDDMVAAYSARTKLPPEQIREMMRKTTTLNAQQAKDYGFADKVLGSYSQAVALGQTIKKMEKKDTLPLYKRIISMLIDAGAPETPTAMSYKTADGKVLNISEDGKQATIDGQPATGSIALEDGRTVVCENGTVVQIKEAATATPAPAVAPAPAPAPVPAPLTAEAQQLKEALAKLATMEAEKQALEAKAKAEETAKVAAEQKVQTQVQALAAVKKEVEALQIATVGPSDPPSKGLNSPMAKSSNAPGSDDMERTVVFLNEHFGWLKQYYPKGHFEKYVDSFTSKYGPSAVSILETSFNYTYPGILTTDIFYKPTLQAPALSDIFTIDQGIKDKKRYNLIGQLDKILLPYTGCTRTFNGNRALITNTTVQVKEFQVSESWCKDDFTQQLAGSYNHLAQEWLKTGNKSFDPSGTPINTIIDKVLTDALQRDVFRRVSFAAGNSADNDYNQIDGLWDRLIDSSGASNYCVVRAGAALGTGTLSAGAALTALEAVYAGSNVLLKDQTAGKPTFWVTRSVWDNLYNSYIGSGAVTEAQFDNLVKGLNSLTYKGFEVKPISLWDSFLAESDNPLFAVTRHLILFTVKVNHILGVEQGSDLNKIEGWYERKDRKFYYEADMKFGYNYLHCDLQTIAY